MTEQPPVTSSSTTADRARRLWRGAGAALTTAALVLGVGTLWSCGGPLSAESDTTSGSFDRAVARVELDIDEGVLSIIAGDAGRVEVERILRWSSEKPTLEETWVGDTLRVTARCAEAGIPLGADPECEVGYTMRVPPDVTVDVQNTSGRVEVRDLGGDVSLTETTGELTVTNVSGNLTLHTTSGQVTASDLRSDRVDVQVDSGDVELGFAAAPQHLAVKATSGNLDIALPGSDPYQVTVQTSTGKQDIAINDDAGATRTITVETSSGDVTIGYRS